MVRNIPILIHDYLNPIEMIARLSRRAGASIARRGLAEALVHAGGKAAGMLTPCRAGQAATETLRRIGIVGQRALTGPRWLRICPVGYLCNEDCVMCWRHTIEPERLRTLQATDLEQGLKLDDYRRLLDDMPPGLQWVEIIGGGEPLLHPQITEIMAEITSRRLSGLLVTNGTLLDEHLARAMISTGWDTVRVSLSAGDAETYRKIHGRDNLDLVVENLKRLGALRKARPGRSRPRLLLLHVLTRESIERIPSLFAIAEELTAEVVYFERAVPFTDSGRLEPSQLARAADVLASEARASRIPTNLDSILPALGCGYDHPAASTTPATPTQLTSGSCCTIGFEETTIMSDGRVLPCCIATEGLGNIRDEPFSEIWQGPAYTALRSSLVSGRFEPYCSDCWAPQSVHRSRSRP